MKRQEALMSAADRMRDIVFIAKDEIGKTGAVSDMVYVAAQAAWQVWFREMTAEMIRRGKLPAEDFYAEVDGQDVGEGESPDEGGREQQGAHVAR